MVILYIFLSYLAWGGGCCNPDFEFLIIDFHTSFHVANCCHCLNIGKGGKNRRRGKNENESEKRELVFKEDGQGEKDHFMF